MHRNSLRPTTTQSDSPTRESVRLFAEAILGKPIPRPMSRAEMARAERQRLEKLAQYSTQHAAELRRFLSAEAEARRYRELVEWAAGISSHAAEQLRLLERQDADDRESLLEGNWDPSKHPRAGAGPNPGWWARKGSGTTSGTSNTKNKNATTPKNAASPATQLRPSDSSYGNVAGVTKTETPTTQPDERRSKAGS